MDVVRSGTSGVCARGPTAAPFLPVPRPSLPLLLRCSGHEAAKGPGPARATPSRVRGFGNPPAVGGGSCFLPLCTWPRFAACAGCVPACTCAVARWPSPRVRIVETRVPRVAALREHVAALQLPAEDVVLLWDTCCPEGVVTALAAHPNAQVGSATWCVRRVLAPCWAGAACPGGGCVHPPSLAVSGPCAQRGAVC